MRRATVATLVAGLAATVSLATPAVAPAAADQGRLKIVNQNVAKQWGSLNAAVNKAVAVNAHAITLQEVCLAHANEMDAYWAGRWTVNWALTKTTTECSGGAVGTLAVWMRGPDAVEEGQDFLLPPDANGTRPTPHMACVVFGSSPNRHVCSVHLSAGQTTADVDARLRQSREVRRVTDAWSGQVVVGGDFNATPGSVVLDPMYAEGGNGRMVEANMLHSAARSTRTTGNIATRNQSKIDYIFFTRNYVNEAGWGSLEVESDGISDHRRMSANVSVDF